MARRVFEIAKELGIAAKAIVAKCHAEGIPESIIKNHMSTVSVGLEATIREWFSEASNATAIETSDKVDLDKVRAKPRRKTGRADDETAGDEPDGGDIGTAVAEPPARASRVPQPPEPAEIPADEPAPVAFDQPEPTAAEPAAPVASVPAVAEAAPEPALAEEPAPLAMPAPQEPTEPLAPAASAPAAPAAPARPTPPPPATRTPTGPSSRPSAHPIRTESTRVAPMNVPTRPKVVAPAGPQLKVQAPVKLAGPKVVRIEQPDFVEAPRPRRPMGGGDASGGSVAPARGPRSGTGVPGAGTDDDRGRAAPRRGPATNNKRRVGAVPERRKGFSGGEEWVAGPTAGITEQDLIEREARLNRAGGFLKKRRQELRRTGAAGERAATPAETGGPVKIAAPFTIKDLSATTGVKAADIVKRLFMQGIPATINSGIEPQKAQEIMIDYDIELEVVAAKTAEEAVSEEFDRREMVEQRARGPIVTILGHVDHGKTSLLDKIRNANVAAGEAGGITQRTSAFRTTVQVAGEEKTVVFIDTPGHEAFTEMRARGANVTDVVVLVVSAPEGVMPQTVESINHAKAAGVPIVVALNKIDRPDATEAAVQKTLGQLAEHGLNPTEWGGETEVVRTSAVTGAGVQDLLEVLDYQAQLKEFKADFGGPARGSVIEARVEEGRGAVANLLVQDGVLRVGDFIVAGRGYGRVRDITDDRGQKLKEALPPMPVQISGIDEIPDAGDKFYVVDSLRKAQEAAEQRRQRERETQLAQPKVTLDSLFSQMADKDLKEILVVVKADAQGSVDVLRHEIEKVTTSEVKVRVLHAAVGGITESDVLLADASKAVIVGFNVIPSGKARTLADQKGVEIRTYDVIYDITDDIRKAAEGLLEPELRQEILGHAEVRKVFKVTRVGSIAGCYVTDGIVQRDALIRVTRQGVVVENDRVLEQLKRVKDDAKEVRAGMECGMKIVGYDDIKEGDILECYRQVKVKRTL